LEGSRSSLHTVLRLVRISALLNLRVALPAAEGSSNGDEEEIWRRRNAA